MRLSFPTLTIGTTVVLIGWFGNLLVMGYNTVYCIILYIVSAENDGAAVFILIVLIVINLTYTAPR